MKFETIIEPNEHILGIQERYIEIVKQALPGRHVEMVGGMAVPMTGRPELDILVITDDVEGDTQKMEAVGFGHRGFADEASYLKQVVEGIEVTLHIMREDNKIIPRQRAVVELLKNDDTLRKEYEDFKRTLSGLGRDEYKKRKVEWLEKNILSKLND